MFSTNQISKLSLALITMWAFLFLKPSTILAQGWESFKLPGGAPHKTVFIDHPDIDAMASVNMGDRLSIKSYSGGAWAEQWTQVGHISTWGLDWADIGGEAHIVTSGDRWVNVYYFNGNSWELDVEEDLTDPNFHVEESIFYDDNSNGIINEDEALICRSQTNNEDFGIYYYNVDEWVEMYYNSPYTTEGFGYRMWRCIQNPDSVYMTGKDGDGAEKIFVEDIPDAITNGFSPAEIITPQNVNEQINSVEQVPCFCQWTANLIKFQYVVAYTTDNGGNRYDVWKRTYASGAWTNWSVLVNDIDEDLPALINDDDTMGYIRIAARAYKYEEDIYHRIYIYTTKTGLLAYNTQENPISAIKLSDSADKNTEGYTVQDIYICPFASDDDSDVIVYGQSQLYTLIWDGAKVLSSTYDTQSLNSRP